METNQKIIIGAVGFVIMGILSFYFGAFGSSSDSGEGEYAQGLAFDSPIVDETKIENSTKKELYDSNVEDFDDKTFDSIADNLSFIDSMKKRMTTDSSQFDDDAYQDIIAQQQEQEELEDVNAQLEMLMALQKGNAGQNDPSLYTDPNAIAALYGNPNGLPAGHGAPVQEEEVIPERIIPNEGQYFFSPSSASKKNSGTNLIPAEVVDQGMQKNGTTVAIRIKQKIEILEQNIKIPKNSVIYGVVSFEETRLLININKYKRDNKLYDVDINVYDYDGREGIHLDHRTIFSIPSNVSKEVSNAAIQRYTQAAGLGGGDNNLTGKDIKTLTALSAAKEVSRELFDKRRVFLPRKYHLWLTVNNNLNN